MKPFTKKEPSPCSVSDDSPPQRPKRSTCQKNLGITNGLLWREETDLKRALYASLQETRRRNLEDDDEEPEEEEKIVPNVQATENGEESPKKAKVHAQRKFAQGSTPNSPIPTPLKVPYVNSSTTELLPYRRPKTEDFLTFLCLRGTSILPPSLDFLNSCSKSDSSSDCRSLSPEPEIKECSNVKEISAKNSDSREKINAKHEIVENGLRKHACKASSKRHPGASQVIKKTSSTVLKSQKEVSIVRKRKSRDQSDQDFIPTNVSSRLKSSCNGRTRSSTFHALREKYKKQRIAADKKKLLPVKNTTAPSSLISHTRGHATRSQSIKSLSKRNSPEVVETKTRLKPGHVILTKNKQTRIERKLAMEKRKSLRSAHPTRDFSQKRISVLGKKTPWLRRAKLVPPIVDVDSDSEPEIISAAPTKKITPAVTPGEIENVSNKNPLSERLRSRRIASKVHSHLSSRQVLLRKHMQNRLKAKKNILKNKNIKSRTIIKRATKQNMYKKVRKSLVIKTMSLRKDLQNKRVTRSAKHQIEELFWSNPEKRSKVLSTKRIPVSKSDKKRVLPKNFPPPKRQKVVHTVKDLKPSKCQSKEPLKKKTIVVDGARASKQNTSVSDVLKVKESVKITRSSKVLAPVDDKPSTSSAVCSASLLPKSKTESMSNIKSTGANATNTLLHTKSKTESMSNIKSTGTNVTNTLLHTKSKTESMSNIKNTGPNATNTLLHTKSKPESMSNIKNTGANVTNTLLHAKSKTESASNVKSTGANVTNTVLHTKSKTENMSNIKSTGVNVTNTILHTKSKTESMSNIKSTGANATNTLLHTKSKTESMSNIKNTGAGAANTLLHTKSKTESMSNIKSTGANVANSLNSKSRTESISHTKASENTPNAVPYIKTISGNVPNVKNLASASSEGISHSKTQSENISHDKNWETKASNVSLPSKAKIENAFVKNIPPATFDTSHSKTKTVNISNDKNAKIAHSSVSSHPNSKSENISNVKSLVTVPNTFTHPKDKVENGANLKTSSNIKNSCANLSKENGVSTSRESRTVNIPTSEQSSSFDVKHITDIHKPSTSSAGLQSLPDTFDSEISKMNLLPSIISEVKTLNRVSNNTESNKNDFGNKDT
ncbi:Protein Jumonji, partial [Stegodyphus mimosarum]